MKLRVVKTVGKVSTVYCRCGVRYLISSVAEGLRWAKKHHRQTRTENPHVVEVDMSRTSWYQIEEVSP